MDPAPLFEPLTLPSGVTLQNRIAKSAMSDSLGDGTGHPTHAQIRLYERWAEGGLGLSIIGEVQGDPGFAEKPGNLVLNAASDLARFRALAEAGQAGGAALWPQLGHAGAMAHPPIGTPKGPSALDLPGLTCEALTTEEIAAIPATIASTAARAKDAGFGGVEVHAAHGFLLNQFLSPLFNHRDDAYGGALEGRMRLLLEVVEAVREAVGPGFPVGLKLNATDQLEGGFEEEEALKVVSALDGMGLDLLDISGGTYFPGAPSASDKVGGSGAYFLSFAKRAKPLTRIPLMVTGGFKTLEQALAARKAGIDVIGLARALVLAPDLPKRWQTGAGDPVFPRFEDPPEGGVTAWYTMRLTALGEDRDEGPALPLDEAIAAYDARDNAREAVWNLHFGR